LQSIPEARESPPYRNAKAHAFGVSVFAISLYGLKISRFQVQEKLNAATYFLIITDQTVISSNLYFSQLYSQITFSSKSKIIYLG